MWKFVLLLVVLGSAVSAAGSDYDKVNSNVEGASTRPSDEIPEPVRDNRRKITQINSPNQWKPLKKSKYLTYLFRKYGSGGLITFEVSFVRNSHIDSL